jgi:hypothetical protein
VLVVVGGLSQPEDNISCTHVNIDNLGFLRENFPDGPEILKASQELEKLGLYQIFICPDLKYLNMERPLGQCLPKIRQYWTRVNKLQ